MAICYKDTTFCGSDVEVHTCDRELTAQDRENAARIGLPIATAYFCNHKKK